MWIERKIIYPEGAWSAHYIRPTEMTEEVGLPPEKWKKVKFDLEDGRTLIFTKED